MKQVTPFPSIQFQGDEASGGHQAGRSARGQELGDCGVGVQLQVLQEVDNLYPLDSLLAPYPESLEPPQFTRSTW